jgi:hypothetical protein
MKRKVSYSISAAVGAFHHADILSTARAVITAVSRANRTAHTKVSLRIDQRIHETNPAPTHPITETKSLLTIDMIKAQSATIANKPEQIVKKRDAPNPMHLSTIFSNFFIAMLLR